MRMLFNLTTIICLFLIACNAISTTRVEGETVYSNKNASISLTKVGNYKLNFKILKGVICASKGQAVRSLNVDPEIDVGIDGLAYPSYEYLFGDTCLISFRLELNIKEPNVFGKSLIASVYNCDKTRAKCKLLIRESLVSYSE